MTATRVSGRLNDQELGALRAALTVRYSQLAEGPGSWPLAVDLFRAAGALGLRASIPYDKLPDLGTSDRESPWRIGDDGQVWIHDGTLIGHVWTPQLDPGQTNFSCLHSRCPANLETYPRQIEAAAAAEDHWRNCPANHN